MQILLGLIAGAAALRFATLGLQSFDHEEAVTAVGVLRPSLPDTVSQTLVTERSGPVYYIIAWAWTRVFGTSEVGLRSLSALVGTLTVPAAYLFAKSLISRRAGLIAGALVAFNPDLVWYSQEGRSYALFVFLSALGLYYFARALQDTGRRSFVWWVVTSSLAMAVHYFAGFLVVGEALWLLVASRSRRLAVAAVGATAAVTLLLVPLAIVQQGEHPLGLGGAPGKRAPVGDTIHHTIAGRVAETAMKFVTGEQLALDAGLLGGLEWVALLGTAALAALAVSALVRSGETRARRGAVVSASIGALALAIPVIAAVGGIDFLKTRNLIGSIVPLLVAMAAGLALRATQRVGPVAAALLCAVLASVTIVTAGTPPAQRQDWRGVGALLGPPKGLRVLVVPRTADDILLFYLRDNHVRLLATKRRELQKASVYGYPASALPVSEIAVVSDQAHDARPAPGFRLVQRRSHNEFTVKRYRATTPTRVDVNSVYRANTVQRPRSVLVDGTLPG